tara:strand:+ start:867 stop:1733 length:867 start_codon:yes stop_codon:yes gene_type:complete
MRNNEKRLGMDSGPAHQSDAAPVTQAAQQPQGLSFVVPTEFVELPSKGRFYVSGHPLHDQEVVEIRYMTAKEEDILTSSTLLRRGLALERLLSNILLDSAIDPLSLLSGDRNAILVAARQSGYGALYETKVSCPSCGQNAKHGFDLEEKTMRLGCLDEDLMNENNARLEDTVLYVTLPKTGANLGLKLLTGKDETHLSDTTKKRKAQGQETVVTDQLSTIIVSLNGERDSINIRRFVDSMPISDSKYLRKLYKKLTPNIDLAQSYGCINCGYLGEMEVPFNTDFFWPD